jgi:hypothetical protein
VASADAVDPVVVHGALAPMSRAAKPKRRSLSLWWRTRPLWVSVWDASSPERWAMTREMLLAERRLADEEAGDARAQ